MVSLMRSEEDLIHLSAVAVHRTYLVSTGAPFTFIRKDTGFTISFTRETGAGPCDVAVAVLTDPKEAVVLRALFSELNVDILGGRLTDTALKTTFFTGSADLSAREDRTGLTEVTRCDTLSYFILLRDLTGIVVAANAAESSVGITGSKNHPALTISERDTRLACGRGAAEHLSLIFTAEWRKGRQAGTII